MENGQNSKNVTQAKHVKIMRVIKRVNKRAAENALSTLIEIIFFAILLILVALPITQKFMSTLGPKTGEKKALETLVLEINNLEDGKEGTIPIYLENLILKGFKIEAKKPGICKIKDRACICLCKSASCDETAEEVKSCLSLDYGLQKEYVIMPKKIDGKPRTQSCRIKRAGKEISISECVT